MIIRITDQYVCIHRAQAAFRKTRNAVGAVYEIACEKDSECPNQLERSKREDSPCVRCGTLNKDDKFLREVQ